MPVPYEVESLDSVDEKYHSDYVEKDGKYVFDVTGIDTAEELKSALRKERSLHGEASKKYKDLKRKIEEQDAKSLEENKEFEDLYKKTKAEKEELFETVKTQASELFLTPIVAKITTNEKKIDTARNLVLKFTEKMDDGSLKLKGFDSTEELISHLKEEYQWIFDGSKASGGGATGSASGGSAIDYKKLSPVQRIKEARKRGKKP
jgi:hypothetical protein